MPDLDLPWGGDLQVSATGDLATVDGLTRSEQRIVRRLFTNLGAYIFHLDYGASIPARIGTNLNAQLFQAIIYSQMLLEDSVAQNPPPKVSCVANYPDSVNCTIIYFALPDGVQATLKFDYPPTTSS